MNYSLAFSRDASLGRLCLIKIKKRPAKCKQLAKCRWMMGSQKRLWQKCLKGKNWRTWTKLYQSLRNSYYERQGLHCESDILRVKQILTEKDRKYSIVPDRKFKSWSWFLREDPHDSGNNAKVSGRTNENWVKFLHVYYYQVITRFYLLQIGTNQDS